MEKTREPVVFRADDFDRLPPPSQTDAAIVRKQTTYWKDVWRTFKKNRTAVISLIAIALLILMVLFGPMMNEYDYRTNDYSALNLSPNAEHWFGTDNMGLIR